MRFHRLFLLLCFIACFVSFRALGEETAVATPEDAPVVTEFTPEQLAAAEQSSEKHEFQAEVSRLMDIIINSLYTNREIFLRELISNAADACDKIRYLSLTQPELLEKEGKLEIKISYDSKAKTITVRDTGIGMNKQQLIQNLGVVAKSGTTEFLQAAAKGTDALSLIGQFGVGFYSVYLVADKVTVVSKAVDSEQYVWESTAESTFNVFKDPRGDTLHRGTEVVLHLKEDALDYLHAGNLERIVKRYSEFINFPIYLWVTHTVDKEVPDEELKAQQAAEAEKAKAEKAAQAAENGEDVEVSDDETPEIENTVTKTLQETVTEWKHMNLVQPIWTRNPKDVTADEYSEFYKTLTKDEGGHLSKIHFFAEGEISFKSILYIPKTAPAGLYERLYDKYNGLRLYVRRVLIADKFEEFLPKYLNFIHGVVDSDDLPLNVNRETLAENKILKVMAKKITRKVIELLGKISDRSREIQKEGTDEEKGQDKYTIFWNQFSKSVKLGVLDDRTNRAKLSKLLRFETTKSEGKSIALDDYIERMKPKQKAIYFIVGESSQELKQSPFLERLVSKGYEVVLMTEPIDEYLVQALTDYDGHALQSVVKENLKIEGDSEDKMKELKSEYGNLLKWLKEHYGDLVEKVVVSTRIKTTPCILVSGQFGWTANMERLMKAQSFGNAEVQKPLAAKKIMEINPYHPIIKEMKKKIELDWEDQSVADIATLMYDAASLSSGFPVHKSNEFAARLHKVIANGLGVDENAKVEYEETPEVEAEPEQAKEENNNDEL